MARKPNQPKITRIPPHEPIDETINVDPARARYVDDVVSRLKARKQQQGTL